MNFKVGDIVEPKDDSPYVITSKNKWVVYEVNLTSFSEPMIRIGEVPNSFEEFNENLRKYFGKKAYHSGHFLEKRRHHGFRAYLVEEAYYNIVTHMGTNKQFANLLSQGDIWEEDSPKKTISAWDNLRPVGLGLKDPPW